MVTLCVILAGTVCFLVFCLHAVTSAYHKMVLKYETVLGVNHQIAKIYYARWLSIDKNSRTTQEIN
jgi:hypothetical protein